MSGEAVFTPIGNDSLRYIEAGLMTLPEGRTYQFEKRYIYQAHNDALRILFDEPAPRLFQDIQLDVDGGESRGDGLHLCSPDTYRSAYHFRLPATFRIVHEVSGPRKAYGIATHYYRPMINRSDPSK